jgi:hypothetical protein
MSNFLILLLVATTLIVGEFAGVLVLLVLR